MINKIQFATEKLQEYIEINKYHGYDIYDGLMSPLFKLKILKSRNIRFVSQQFLRRIPINLRPILRIAKGYNPVTMGLCLEGYSYLYQNDKKTASLDKIEFLQQELVKNQSKGYSGICWGYDFDWESRYSSIPAYTPTVVATGIITNGLWINYQITKNVEIENIILDSSKFVLNDLNRLPQQIGFCFSYSPFDKQIVFNATMKGARLLAQCYYLTGNVEYKDIAKETIDFVMMHQKENGSWIYSHKDKRKWVDNYHTAYILDCLYAYEKYTGDKSYSKQLEQGFNFYRNNFFINNEIPKTFSNKTYPIDSTAVAQSIITLVNFGELELATNIANWVINNFQNRDGSIYYRKNKYYAWKLSFMRWSNAWMFVAFSKLLLKSNKSL